jgi:uncharacterized membrane protein
MNKRQVLLAAALTTLCVANISTASAAAADKEKCFGIAKAGQNDCADANGVHSCAGQSKHDLVATEWKYVAKGTCVDKEHGKLTATK